MYPKLIIDLAKIRHNAGAIVKAAGYIKIFGVTKGCAGSVEVAQAMLDGGAAGLADSRLAHLVRIREHFPKTPLLALRQPMLDEINRIVSLDVTVMVSDLTAARALSASASAVGHRQRVIVMIDIGDGREGVPPSSVSAFIRALMEMKGLENIGIAANVGCRGGIIPDAESMAVIDELVLEAARDGLGLGQVSAGNSSCWNLLRSGNLARSASQLRIGEAILLGRETAGGEAIQDLYQDAFIVKAQVLEASIKTGGRLVVAIGCQDIGSGAISPLENGLEVVRLTSDHAVLSAGGAPAIGSGGLIRFCPDYFGLQALAASTYVGKEYLGYNMSGVRSEKHQSTSTK